MLSESDVFLFYRVGEKNGKKKLPRLLRVHPALVLRSLSVFSSLEGGGGNVLFVPSILHLQTVQRCC